MSTKLDIEFALDNVLRRQRRERIATQVLVGLYTSTRENTPSYCVAEAVRAADALIAALDATPDQRSQ